MIVDDSIIEDFLNCKYKAYLHALKGPARDTEYGFIQHIETERYRQLYVDHMKAAGFSPDTNAGSASHLESTAVPDRNLFLQPSAAGDGYHITLDALMLGSGKRKGRFQVVAIMTSPKEQVTVQDKLGLAMRMMLFDRAGQPIDLGRMVHGREFNHTVVRHETHQKTVKKLIRELTRLVNTMEEPMLYRHSHCRICCYAPHCLKRLTEKDHLSLVTGLTSREIEEKTSRGIFTVHQLAYAFRPKKFKAMQEKRKRFSPELKALAVKDNKTFVYQVPDIHSQGTEIYLDFEGLPDEQFDYLIGIVVRNGDSETRSSLWANGKEEEKRIFEDLISILLAHPASRIYHYGSYEMRSLSRIFKDHGFSASVLSDINDQAVNLLTYFHQGVYVPTYTNELKDVGRHCGFTWSHKKASGIQSIVWRKRWEMTGRTRYKKLVMQYNIEDCEALVLVKNWLARLHERMETNAGRFERVDWLPSKAQFYFGTNHFLIPDFEKINDCAYFDFQTKVVLPKTNPSFERRKKGVRSKASRKPKVNVQTQVVFPEACPYCGYDRFYRHVVYQRRIIDLRWMKDGIKRWVTQYRTGNLRCIRCRKITTPEKLHPARFGRNVFLWALHLNVTYRLSFEAVKRLLAETFGIKLTRAAIHRYRGVLAEEYRRAYDEILEDMVKGDLIQIDETQAKTGRFDGYVWVFATRSSVYYRYRPSREAGFLKDVLINFNGVLVSDFYSGYDSLPCAQQKCLIHLIRDINDDLLKNPLDAELREMSTRFGGLLGSIVDTINRHGLKRTYLVAHKQKVERFFQEITEQDYLSAFAIKYRERLMRNQERLFTFLDKDGVPWNNNNAEHGIKHFAKYRRSVPGLISVKRLEEHLVFLSIFQTCEYRGLNFLDFLKSGQRTISDFEKLLSEQNTRRQPAHRRKDDAISLCGTPHIMTEA